MQMAYVQSHCFTKCLITRFDCQDSHRDAPVPTRRWCWGCCTSLGLSEQGPEPVFRWRRVIRQQSIVPLVDDPRQGTYDDVAVKRQDVEGGYR